MWLSLWLLSFLHHPLLFYSLWTDFYLRGLAEESFNSLVRHKNLAQHVRFPFFEKLKLFNETTYARFPSVYTRRIFSLVLLKIFWNFWNSSRKKSTLKQPFSGVYKIDVLKKFANFTKKHQCWSHFLKKSPEIKRPRHRCFPVNFEKLLRTPFLQSTSGGVGVRLLRV